MGGYIESWMNGAAVIALAAKTAWPFPEPPAPLQNKAEILKLEQRVRQGDGTAIMPYAQSRLAADHPALLTPGGIPKYVIGFYGQDGMRPADVRTAMQRANP